MTTKELVSKIAEEAGITKVKADEIYNLVLSQLQSELVSTGEVNIKGIGRIRTKAVPARTCRNPQDGSPVDKPASTKVQFKASSTLKKAVNA